MTPTAATTIDEYISSFPPPVQKKLQQIRNAIKKVAPTAGEAIKYAIPTFTLNGNLVHFAAYKHHIGFYATPTGHEAFQKELSGYKTGRGSVQFPLNKPLPMELITQMVAFRVAEQMEKKSKIQK